MVLRRRERGGVGDGGAMGKRKEGGLRGEGGG